MRKLLVFSWSRFLNWMCWHVTYTKQIFRLFHCSDVQNTGHESSCLISCSGITNKIFFSDLSVSPMHVKREIEEQQHFCCSKSLFLLDAGYWSLEHCWCCLYGWAPAFWNSKSLSKMCLFPVWLLKAFPQSSVIITDKSPASHTSDVAVSCVLFSGTC